MNKFVSFASRTNIVTDGTGLVPYGTEYEGRPELVDLALADMSDRVNQVLEIEIINLMMDAPNQVSFNPEQSFKSQFISWMVRIFASSGEYPTKALMSEDVYFLLRGIDLDVEARPFNRLRLNTDGSLEDIMPSGTMILFSDSFIRLDILEGCPSFDGSVISMDTKSFIDNADSGLVINNISH